MKAWVKGAILIPLVLFLPSICYSDEFMGGSAWAWFGFFLFAGLIIALPFIITGCFIKYRTVFYVLIIWIVMYFGLHALSRHYSPLVWYDGPLKPILINLGIIDYSPVYAVGLLLGAYISKKKELKKLDSKIPPVLLATIISLLPWASLLLPPFF